MKTRKLSDKIRYTEVTQYKMTIYTKQRNSYVKANRNHTVFTTGIKISVYSWDKIQLIQLGSAYS